jgi:hypothetical protein
VSHQDASAEEEHNASTTSNQEPPGDAPEDADNLSAKDAGHATNKNAKYTTIKLYFHNPVMPCKISN